MKKEGKKHTSASQFHTYSLFRLYYGLELNHVSDCLWTLDEIAQCGMGDEDAPNNESDDDGGKQLQMTTN